MGAAPQAPRTRVTARARDLRFDAGSLSLNLVATVGRRPVGPVERMGDVERLAAWCSGVGLTPAPGYEAEALLRSLHALRDAAYDIASSLLDGHRPSPASVDLVNGLAACEPPVARLELTPAGVRPAPGGDLLTEDVLLSMVARDLIGLVSDASRGKRLTMCASEVCRMLYLNPASGRARQWCSMRRCGNNAKAAAHRRRRAATAEG
ncbi:CGNR zinc finger domain-containing protein [Streptomyces griseoincarnatus]|uniref:CGNR zinc finger domain-containing protein n=1 Tax=Streptomyces tunisiensis TaxID=948699 RepID=A0ABP7YIG3_9ACTN|nr:MULTISPECIES: CGNR zinc finger domain-containing protein [unclassified Streptomyces]MBU5944617.1 CGNR zinc finger domain-containing protein [Streptomyces sp. PAM3C]